MRLGRITFNSASDYLMLDEERRLHGATLQREKALLADRKRLEWMAEKKMTIHKCAPPQPGWRIYRGDKPLTAAHPDWRAAIDEAMG